MLSMCELFGYLRRVDGLMTKSACLSLSADISLEIKGF